MKKIYFTPECEVTEIELSNMILSTSGGGISDDNSAHKSDDESDPGDFGW